MSRVIEFRAQCAETKRWIYGLPATETTLSNTITHIAQFAGKRRLFGRHYVRIIPETVGQFTGLTDKNGKRIYEGDKVRYTTSVKYDAVGDPYIYDGVIQLWNGQMGCGIRYKSGRYTMMVKTSHAYRMEVIGNIHEQQS